VYCDMTSTVPATGQAPGFTYFRCHGCARVEPYTSAAQGDCPAFGLEMALWSADTANSKQWLIDNPADWGGDVGSPTPDFWAPWTDSGFAEGTTDDYLCSTNDAIITTPDHAGWPDDSHAGYAASVDHTKISRAEQGKYVIFFHVQDSSGNHECQPTPTRTVIVKDTLPPVITLHLATGGNHVLIHSSNGGTSSAQTGSLSNPAGWTPAPGTTVGNSGGGNPYLHTDYAPSTTTGNSFMAEATVASAHGWVLAGAAAAIGGVAMLALTLTRKEQPIAVEV
jgi:hypothetical protein